MKEQTKGVIQVIIAAFIWSSGGVFIKLVSADPVFIATARCVIAGIALMPFIRFRDIRVDFNLVGLIISYTYTLCTFVVATKLTAAANAIALQYTAPLWLFICMVILKKKISFAKSVPMVFIAAGIILFLLEPAEGTNIMGNLIAVSSGVGFAATTYFFSRPQCISGVGLVGLCNAVAAVIMAMFISYPVSLFDIDTFGWLALIYLGVFHIGGGYILYSGALRYIEPLKATILGLLEPILNPVWVLLFIHEVPTAYAVVGGVFILTGIAIDARMSMSKFKLPFIFS